MFPKVIVMSWQEVEGYKSKTPYVVISFREPDGCVPNFQYDILNRKDILPIEIHDVDDPEFAKKYNYKILDKKQAKKILNFVEEYKDKVETIIVHCHAGVCRSPACAAAILKIFTGDDSQIWDDPLYLPNKHVYNTILEVANKNELELIKQRLQQES